MINDITTDPIDPPRFEAIARLRPRDANPVVYAGLDAAEQQREAYPDIEPLIVSATPQLAYEAASRSSPSASGASSMRARRRPGRPRRPDRGGGAHADHGLPRRRGAARAPDQDGARIDMRSASRYGKHDFGANASRISSLLEEIDEVVALRREAGRRNRRPSRPKPTEPSPAKNSASKR